MKQVVFLKILFILSLTVFTSKLKNPASCKELLQLAEEAARGGQNRQQLLRAGGEADVQCRG